MLQPKYSQIFGLKHASRLWYSAPGMQSFSVLARSAAFGLPLPFIFVLFPPETAVVWLLFVTIQSFQQLADLGFTFTYARVLSYAAAGSETIDLLKENRSYQISQSPNWLLIKRIYDAMRQTYLWIALAWLTILLMLGTVSMARPVAALDNSVEGWLAWGLLLAASTIRIYGNIYVAFLLGMNQVALLYRWEGVTWSFVALLSILSLLVYPSFLLIAIIAQLAWVVNVVLCWKFSHSHGLSYCKTASTQDEVDRTVVAQIWPKAWRTGAGVAVYYGVVQASGIFFAQVGRSVDVGAYLLALNIANLIQQVGNSLFTSKLPTLARLRASGELRKQNEIAERGIERSLWVVAALFILVGAVFPAYFRLADTESSFVPSIFWALMGISAILFRFGASHLLYYSTTNHIILHKVNLVSGVIILASIVTLYPVIGWYAFPIAQVISSVSFHSWFSARISYRSFRWRFPEHVIRAIGIPFISVLLYVVFITIIAQIS